MPSFLRILLTSARPQNRFCAWSGKIINARFPSFIFQVLMASLWKDKVVTLYNGICMPAIGLGTFRLKGQETIDLAVSAALHQGYRHIDTASVYRNEGHIAETLQKLQIPRGDIFITSKLGPKDHGTEKAEKAFQQTLTNLKTDYLDLYLIHWPGVQGLKVEDPQNRVLRQQSWQVLERLYSKGQIKAIGVSNYGIKHMEELLENCQIKPHVNQVEVHPHYKQQPLLAFCEGHDIHVTAYSSLGTSVKDVNHLISDARVAQIADRRGLSSAQVLLLWALEKGLSVLPKSSNPQHIQENINFGAKLTSEDMDELNAMEINTKYAWNAEFVL